MEITEVRISRRTEEDGKLKGYAAVTFDDVFVVRDLKIIEGKKGLFVAMPSQKIQAPCPKCKKKNAIRSKFCNDCGVKLPQKEKTRRELHRDIAHPVNSDMRSYLQKVIIEAYQANDTKPYDENEGYSEMEEMEGASEENREIRMEKPVQPDDYLSTPSLALGERSSKTEYSDEESSEILDTIERK